MTFITQQSLAPVYLYGFLKFYLYQSGFPREAEPVGRRYRVRDWLQGIGYTIIQLARQIWNL